VAGRDPPNDRELRLFSLAPCEFYPYWRFIVGWPDYEYVEHMCVADSSQILGECLTPPVLPNPCYWEAE